MTLSVATAVRFTNIRDQKIKIQRDYTAVTGKSVGGSLKYEEMKQQAQFHQTVYKMWTILPVTN